MPAQDEFGTLSELRYGGLRGRFFTVNQLPGADGLPRSRKVILDNMVHMFGVNDATAEDVISLADWTPRSQHYQVHFFPFRVLMPDLSGIPSLIDLAAMRDVLASHGADTSVVDWGIGGIEAEATAESCAMSLATCSGQPPES